MTIEAAMAEKKLLLSQFHDIDRGNGARKEEKIVCMEFNLKAPKDHMLMFLLLDER